MVFASRDERRGGPPHPAARPRQRRSGVQQLPWYSAGFDRAGRLDGRANVASGAWRSAPKKERAESAAAPSRPF